MVVENPSAWSATRPLCGRIANKQNKQITWNNQRTQVDESRFCSFVSLKLMNGRFRRQGKKEQLDPETESSGLYALTTQFQGDWWTIRIIF